jgi:pimeloyl-ACP methyl ester carboxylesterase
VSAQSVTLQASGLALHAIERNPEGTPPVLFLHGWLDHAHGFDWLCDALPEAWRMLALDFRGHGDSEHLSQGYYHFTDYLGDVDAAVDHLTSRGEARVHLVGHSMGGAISALYAAGQPDRVRSIAMMESLGPIGGPPDEMLGRLRRSVKDLHKPKLRRTYASLAEAVARVRENNSSLSLEAAEHLTRLGTRAADGGIQFKFDPALRRTGPYALDEAQILAILGGVQCPVTILHASNGLTFDDAQMRERLAKLGSPSPIRVDGGHHVHLDRPAEVAEHIRHAVEVASGV